MCQTPLFCTETICTWPIFLWRTFTNSFAKTLLASSLAPALATPLRSLWRTDRQKLKEAARATLPFCGPHQSPPSLWSSNAYTKVFRKPSKMDILSKRPFSIWLSSTSFIGPTKDTTPPSWTSKSAFYSLWENILFIKLSSFSFHFYWINNTIYYWCLYKMLIVVFLLIQVDFQQNSICPWRSHKYCHFWRSSFGSWYSTQFEGNFRLPYYARIRHDGDVRYCNSNG